MAVVRNVVVRLGADISGVRQNLRRASQQFEKFGNGMKNIGTNLTTNVSTPLAGLGFVAIKTAADFEKAMSNVKAVTGASGEDFEMLRNKAREMGKATSKSATEAADAIGYMGLAGWDTKQIMEGIEPVLRLSEAGNLDLARTSDLVTDSMSALGLETKDLAKYLDQAAQTSRKSNTSIEQLLEAGIVVGGMFKNLNVPLAESNALLGVLANRGIKGSEAGTSLNSILINLTSGAGQAGKAMEALNLSAFNSDGSFKGVTQTLIELNAKTKDMTDKQKNMYLAAIGGKTQIDTLNALLDGMNKELIPLTGNIEKSDGALTDMAKTMQDNLYGQLNVLKSTFSEFAIQMGNVLLPEVKKITSKFQKLGEWLGKLSKPAQKSIVIFGLIAVVLPPILAAVGGMIAGIGALAGALAAISAPVIGVVAGIGVLIAAFVSVGIAVKKLYKKNEKFKNSIDKLSRVLISKFNQVKNEFKVIFDSMNSIVSKVMPIMKKYIDEFVLGAINTFSNFVDVIEGLFQGDFKAVFNGLGKIATEAWGKFEENFNAVFEKWKNNVKESFKEDFFNIDTIVEKVKTKFSEMVENTKTKLEEQKQNIIQKFTDTKTSVTEFFDSLPELAKNKLIEFGKAITTFLEEQHEENKRQFGIWWDMIQKWHEEIPGKISSELEKWKETITKWYEDTKTKVEDKLNLWGESITNWFESVPSRIDEKLKTWGETITNWYKETKTKIEDKLKEWGDSITNWFEKLPKRVEKGFDDGLESLKNSFNRAKKDVEKKLDEIWEKMKSWFEKVPEKPEIKDSGKKSIEKVIEGIDEKNQDMLDKIGEVFVKAAKGAFAVAVVVLVAVGREIIKAIIKGCIEYRAFIRGEINNIITGIVEIFQELIDSGYQMGVDFIDQIKSGISSKVEKIKKVVKDLTEKLGNFFPRSPAKEGALKHTVKMGRTMMEQIATGMMQGENYLEKAVKHATNLISPALSSELDVTGEGTNGGISKMPIEIPIYLDGKKIATGIMPHVARESRFVGGVT